MGRDWPLDKRLRVRKIVFDGSIIKVIAISNNRLEKLNVALKKWKWVKNTKIHRPLLKFIHLYRIYLYRKTYLYFSI